MDVFEVGVAEGMIKTAMRPKVRADLRRVMLSGGRGSEYARSRLSGYYPGKRGVANIAYARGEKDKARALLPGKPRPGPRMPSSHFDAHMKKRLQTAFGGSGHTGVAGMF